MTATLDVTNNSDMLLSYVEVAIVSIDDYWQYMFNDERIVVRDVGVPPAPFIIRQSCSEVTVTLPPGAKRRFLVAYCDDTNGPPAQFNTVPAVALSRGAHKIVVEISAHEVSVSHYTFFLECHPNYAGVRDGLVTRSTEATMEMCPWEEYRGVGSDELPAPQQQH
jgi:hypothetical protein